jgi:hypothetical protein
MENLIARHCRMMAEMIDDFENYKITLRRFIDELSGVTSFIEEDRDWHDRLVSQWGAMEDVYASALDKGMKELPPEYAAQIWQAIDRLKELIAAKLAAADR